MVDDEHFDRTPLWIELQAKLFTAEKIDGPFGSTAANPGASKFGMPGASKFGMNSGVKRSSRS